MHNTPERTQSLPRRSKTSTRIRSASQPSSNSSIKNTTPYSAGDEMNTPKVHLADDHSDEDRYQSATLLKDITPPSFENNILITEIPEPGTPDGELKSGHAPSNKPSSSGIPLRIKSPPATKPQTPTRPSTPTPSSKRSSVGPLKLLGKSSEAAQKNQNTATRRNLETQFQSKKKKMEELKKEILNKQKPLVETYQCLVQLKKKLADTGKIMPLEELTLDISDSRQAVGLSRVPPEIVEQMRKTVKEVPLSLIEICRNLMNKRLILVDLLEKMAQQPTDPRELKQNLQALQNETENIESSVTNTFQQHERNVSDLVQKWEILLNSTGSAEAFDQIELLQETIRKKEHKVAELNKELHELQNKHDAENTTAQHAITELTNKIKAMEHDLNRERCSSKEHQEKGNLGEQRTKLLKARIKELEIKQKETETKCLDYQKAHRNTQEQLKSHEHRWIKEREDLLKKQQTDRQMLEKFTKDRSFFETRVKTLEELLDDKENTFKLLETRMKDELELARKISVEDRTTKESLQQKFNSLKNQLVEMEIRNKQAIDLVHTKNSLSQNDTDEITTEREAELYTELLATRVALKAAEDQIQTYNREKMRFIDSIQSLQGDPDKDHEYIAKTLIRNVENITELETKLRASDETVCTQRIEIANLKVDIEHLKQRPAVLDISEVDDGLGGTSDGDLKVMLHEGRMKLEQSLKKALEYEHKIIRCEHDINRQGKQICEMENLLKVRDGLISMMKCKKDELQMENDSLNKYATEIRDLLLQGDFEKVHPYCKPTRPLKRTVFQYSNFNKSKEEANNRTDLIQELSNNLDNRGRVCAQLEKRVKELEGCLSDTNEKRYKLQDTIGAMEKELQSTKAHMGKIIGDLPVTQYGSSTRKPDSPMLVPNNLITPPQQLSEIHTANIKCDLDTFQKQLKYLKRSFRTISNMIFENNFTLHQNLKEIQQLGDAGDNFTIQSLSDPILQKSEEASSDAVVLNNLRPILGDINMLESLAHNPNGGSSTNTNLSAPKSFYQEPTSSEEKKPLLPISNCKNKSSKNLARKSSHSCSISTENKSTYQTGDENTEKNRIIAPSYFSYSSSKSISEKSSCLVQSTLQILSQVDENSRATSSSLPPSAKKHSNKLKPRSKPTSPNLHKMKKVLYKSESESSAVMIDENYTVSETTRPNTHILAEQQNFINHAHNISYHLNKTGDIGQSNVIHSSCPLVCSPIEVNLITHSLHRIKDNKLYKFLPE